MTDKEKDELTRIIQILKDEQKSVTGMDHVNTFDVLKLAVLKKVISPFNSELISQDIFSLFPILMSYRPGCPVKKIYVKHVPRYVNSVQNPHECDEWDRAYLAAIMNHLFYKHEWTINEVIHWLEVDILQGVEKTNEGKEE